MNAAADQQGLMPESTANTWLMTKPHDELIQDEEHKGKGAKGAEKHDRSSSSRDQNGLAKSRLRKNKPQQKPLHLTTCAFIHDVSFLKPVQSTVLFDGRGNRGQTEPQTHHRPPRRPVREIG